MPRNQRPSLTVWILSGTGRWFVDTLGMARDIVAGKIPAPDAAFYRRFCVGAGLLSALVAGYILSPYKLIYNYTASEDLGWYLLEEIGPQEEIRRGDMLLVSYQCPVTEASVCAFEDVVHFRDGDNLIKRAQGLPGDTVEGFTESGVRHNQLIWNSGILDVGPIQATSKSGVPIEHFFWAKPPVEIPEGQLYVGNQNSSRAFDSRYFGLIDRSQVKGLLKKM